MGFAFTESTEQLDSENRVVSEKTHYGIFFDRNTNPLREINSQPLISTKENSAYDYKTVSGRTIWLSRDPIGESGHELLRFNSDPQAYNVILSLNEANTEVLFKLESILKKDKLSSEDVKEILPLLIESLQISAVANNISNSYGGINTNFGNTYSFNNNNAILYIDARGRIGFIGAIGGAIQGGIAGYIAGRATGGRSGGISGAIGGVIGGAIGGAIAGPIAGGALGGAIGGGIGAGLNGGNIAAGIIGGAIGGALGGTFAYAAAGGSVGLQVGMGALGAGIDALNQIAVSEIAGELGDRMSPSEPNSDPCPTGDDTIHMGSFHYNDGNVTFTPAY